MRLFHLIGPLDMPLLHLIWVNELLKALPFYGEASEQQRRGQDRHDLVTSRKGATTGRCRSAGHGAALGANRDAIRTSAQAPRPATRAAGPGSPARRFS
jgi:hypothetical protein